MATIVYKYGTPARVNWPAEADRQIRLAHDLWNELVALDRRREEAVAAVWAAHPEVAAAQQALTDAQEQLQELREAAKRTHVRDRSRTTPAALKEQIAEARRRVRDLKAAARQVRDDAYATVKPQMAAIAADHKAAVKATYTDYAQTRGLFWATYNDVVDRFRVASRRVAEQRRQGRPAQLRFHRWTGEGTLTVQLQRQDGKPTRTPGLLASGEGPWRNVATLTPWVDPAEWEQLPRAEQRRRRLGTLTMRLNTAGDRLELPVIVHRMMPADADVALIRVTRRRIAGNMRTTVTVTAKLPDVDIAAPTGPAVAVHLGWRALPDRDLRVAVLAAATALPPPPAGLPVRVHGPWAEVVVPASWRNLADRIEAVRSRRDRSLDRLREQLVGWLEEHPVEGGPTAAEVARWRSPARFAALAQRWRDHPPEGIDAAALEAWRRQDRHLWEWEAHERDQLLARRRDAWRKVAAWVTSHAGMLVLADVEVASLTRRPAVEDPDPEQARRARANRVLASPGDLREALSQAAARRGVAVKTVEAAGITITHPRCGTTFDRGDEVAADPLLWCPICEQAWDQDHGAALIQLERATGSMAA